MHVTLLLLGGHVPEWLCMSPYCCQVVMYYGPRTNSELLLHSGFVVKDNINDYLAVKLGQPRAHMQCRAVPCGATMSLLYTTESPAVTACDQGGTSMPSRRSICVSHG